jgi:hypothetical protein
VIGSQEADRLTRKRAKPISAHIHVEGTGASGGRIPAAPRWLTQMRSETNASIAFMVTMVQQ